MYTRRRRSNKQKGGRSKTRSRSSTTKTQSQRTPLPNIKEEQLSSEEKKLMEFFASLPDKLKNAFILNKKILNPRQRAIFKLAMEQKRMKVASSMADSPYRNE